jgi:hypothetical protein
MAKNDNIKYRFIQNIGDYFPAGYFGEDFLDKVQKQVGMSSEGMKQLCTPFPRLRQEYNAYKNVIVTNKPRTKDAIKYSHEFHSKLLEVLGYESDHPYERPFPINEETGEVIPVRHVLSRNGKVRMLIMEMQHLIKLDEDEPAGLFDQQYDCPDDGTIASQRYRASQWKEVFHFDDAYKISPNIINKAVTALFLLPENRPHFILMLAGNTVFLFDADKWSRGAYLQFSLDDLFSQASVSTYRLYYALFYLLVCKDTLAADSETVLMDALIEDSYKNAYEVTKDLKEGVVRAVETLANEAVFYKHNVLGEVFDETNDTFESEVKDDCLTIVYRLLFIFYAESRSELGILPTNDEIYNKGYSLEMLRDLEQTRLISEESRNGYFFDESLQTLFRLLGRGFNSTKAEDKSFVVRKIDSPLFDNHRLKHLGNLKVRNAAWQEIIQSLSLSKKNGYCGRISYANLGVNQLGSVYESLLAYRGFYAEEDYIEVQDPAHTDKGQFLVPYSRMKDFDLSEVIKNEDGSIRRLKKGSFVYRLNGRDRQKSASYYTPEVLTRSTVKYTLKSILDEVEAGTKRPAELLELKILEPAMGAAAFQNEVINQLAEAYLTYQQQYLNRRVDPDRYRDELQKVKAYIATHNVYGVDLNPTAIELGKLSLWLNVMHKDMQTPFFSNRLAVGNAVVGAWLKVYNKSEVLGTVVKKKLVQNPWWEKAPHKVKFFANRVNRSANEIYHFLLPDKNMLGVLSIAEQKKAYPSEAKRMKAIKDDWTKPINSYEFDTLQKLSVKIDLLLKEYFAFQSSIESITKNRMQLWGISGEYENALFEDYSTKERLNDTRYRHDNAYFRLRTVMDYWCSLWFWEYDEAASLPTREDYWADINAILDVDDAKLNKRTVKSTSTAMTPGSERDLFSEPQAQEEPTEAEQQQTEAESAIIVQTKEEILAEVQGGNTLFNDSQRIRIVIDKAKRYHFFHPMLEFLEVFWKRDGFDIICGNPPWIKLQFDDKAVMSDRFPEVVIHNMSAPDARAIKERILEDPLMNRIYQSELIETTCSAVFMNAYCNYPLLVGQQTNLYKCVLTNCFDLSSTDNGYIGLLCPESIYDDPNGKPLRKELYRRLRYHFQYENELVLFTETNDHGRMKFGCHICGSRKESPKFASINNVFHPNTIDACFAHDGHGKCEGIKDDNGKWNTNGHRKRIVHITSNELKIISSAFEDSEDWEAAKLVSIHNEDIIEVLRSLSTFPTHVIDFDIFITRAIEQTSGVDKGIIIRDVSYPDWTKNEMIFSGPHFWVSEPLYKTPLAICTSSNHYDKVDLESIDDNYTSRTCYKPLMNLTSYRSLIKGFINGQDKEGKPNYGLWIDEYRVVWRFMLNLGQERTLITAIIPPNCSHIHGVNSAIFRRTDVFMEFAALTSSISLDFYIKLTNKGALGQGIVESFPLGVAEKFKPALFVRTLRLNCLTNRYAELWEDVWKENYKKDTWSIEDSRLAPWSELTSSWKHETPLRNYFERRMALVEIDVISAMALGLNLDELIMMYEIQFPVLQQNENDTWYDTKGNIVFTCSKGLVGVGVDRPIWETIKEMKAGETYEHTIQKSELYRGQKVTYYAPFDKCDRVEDYKRAWKHFEERFK